MIKIIICGINGRLGQVLRESIAARGDMELIAGADAMPDVRDNGVPVYPGLKGRSIQADCIIDFSRPVALESNLSFAIQNRIPIIIATTGFSPEDKEKIKAASGSIPVFFSANMSLGVNMQFELVREITDFYGDAAEVEIIEKHHNVKADAPSGTALALADIINESRGGELKYKYGRTPEDGRRDRRELGIHSVRGGTFVGEHDVLFITDSEVLTVSHAAQTKQVFADGALRAAEFITGKEPGLYSMKDIVYQTRAVTSTRRTDAVSVIRVNGAGTGETLKRVAERGIYIDVVVAPDARGPVTFSVNDRDGEDAMSALKGLDASIETGLSKITVEGLGMELMHGVASKLVCALENAGVAVSTITTSEKGMEFIVAEHDADAAVRAVSGVYAR